MVNIMDRPNFIDIKNAEEFEEYYWYKEELVVICREIGIDSLGTKFELEERLKNHIRGIKTESNRKKNHNIRQKKMADINLEMKLIPEGFKFNKEAREFFCNYFGIEKFSFTKNMAAALRKAEEDNDINMTVQDLINIYLGKVEVENSSAEKTYQWNNFLKDFCKDKRTEHIKNKLKNAAKLWKIVRDNKGSKKYRTELLDEYSDIFED